MNVAKANAKKATGKAADQADVVIAGAGLVGLALAAALAGGGLDVVLFDPQLDRPMGDPRASTVSAGSRRLLEALGVWEEVAAQAEPVHEMRITDSRLDHVLRPVFLTLAGEVDDGAPFAHVVENAILHCALRAAVEARGVRLVAEAIRTVTPGPGAAEIEAGPGLSLPAPLVIAADGARSRIRERLGIRSRGWTYDQASLVTTVAHTEPHHGAAVQHFLEGGPFALLPMPGNRSYVVWSETRAEAERIAALSDDDFLGELAVRAGAEFGGLSLAGPRGMRPLGLRIAERFIAPRGALVGDAAHAIHPIAGQGVNLGFRDVAALAEVVLDAARLGLDTGSVDVLRRYEEWRRFDTALMVAATDGLLKLFRVQGGAARAVRDVGLGLVDRATPVKAALIRSAAGLEGRLPRLMRGEAL